VPTAQIRTGNDLRNRDCLGTWALVNGQHTLHFTVTRHGKPYIVRNFGNLVCVRAGLTLMNHAVKITKSAHAIDTLPCNHLCDHMTRHLLSHDIATFPVHSHPSPGFPDTLDLSPQPSYTMAERPPRSSKVRLAGTSNSTPSVHLKSVLIRHQDLIFLSKDAPLGRPEPLGIPKLAQLRMI
jgi:hypothetical protein